MNADQISAMIRHFDLQKANAHFEGKWRRCRHKECNKRRKCTGGPRGTMKKTQGKPFCSITRPKRSNLYYPKQSAQ